MLNPQEPVPIVQNGVTLGSVLLWPCHLSKQTHLQDGLGHWNTSWEASTSARIEGTGAKQGLVVGGEFLKALAVLHSWLAVEDMGAELSQEVRKRTDATLMWRAVRLWVYHLLMDTGYLQPVSFSLLPRTEQHIKLGPCSAALCWLGSLPCCKLLGWWWGTSLFKLHEHSPSYFHKGPTLGQVMTAHQTFWIITDHLLLFLWEYLVCVHS